MQAHCLGHTAKFLQDSRQFLSGTGQGQLEVRLAQNQYEIIEAQQLRHRVFTAEFSAPLGKEFKTPFDPYEVNPYCQHLIAIESGKIIGTYRLLSPEGAARAGGMHSETQFDLSRLGQIKQSTIELGRSCIAPEYRNRAGSGNVLRRLWIGLSDMLSTRTERYLMGYVSVSMADGGYLAASLWQALKTSDALHQKFEVLPKTGLPFKATSDSCQVVVPPLMKSYLKLGAKLMGEPHWDVNFQVADFPIMIEAALLETRFSSEGALGQIGARYPHQPLSNSHHRATELAAPQALAY